MEWESCHDDEYCWLCSSWYLDGTSLCEHFYWKQTTIVAQNYHSSCWLYFCEPWKSGWWVAKMKPGNAHRSFPEISHVPLLEINIIYIYMNIYIYTTKPSFDLIFQHSSLSLPTHISHSLYFSHYHTSQSHHLTRKLTMITHLSHTHTHTLQTTLKNGWMP